MALSSKHAILRLSLFPYRVGLGSRYLAQRAWKVASWLVRSREHTNFTYDLTPLNIEYLTSFLSVVTGQSVSTFARYMHEIIHDDTLRRHISIVTETSDQRHRANANASFGRRIGWYALVRSIKPRVVIESGVDKGLGSVVLAAALLRNREEGRAGYLFGTDINPKAGYLLSGPYSDVGRVLYGDSLETLRDFAEPIDLFINDSDHSPEYESEEYDAISSKLSNDAYVIGDNAHVSDRLLRFAAETGRHFLFFQEQPQDHWYPGAGIGIAFR